MGSSSASGASSAPPVAISGRVSHNKRFASAPGGVDEIPEFPAAVYDAIARILIEAAPSIDDEAAS